MGLGHPLSALREALGPVRTCYCSSRQAWFEWLICTVLLRDTIQVCWATLSQMLLCLASMVDAQCVAFSTMLRCAYRVNPCLNFVVLHND